MLDIDIEDWRGASDLHRAIALRRAEWLKTARGNQLPPDHNDWTYWILLAGRGFGKTRTGMEDAAWYGLTNPGHRIALVAATQADARDTLVEGESGLLACLPEGALVKWNRSLGELVLVNDARYKLFSGQEPERLRGPQHHRAYADELCAWEYPETYDQLMFGLRLGYHPKIVITTTPKPTPLVRRILSDPATHITRGSTFDNAGNLAASTIEQLRKKYEGTRLGRQELYAEVLDDVPGALWTRDMIDEARRPVPIPDLRRVVVAIDPSGARDENDENADEIGIIVAGKDHNDHAYVLADRSCRLSPLGWAQRAIHAYREFNADCIIAERNYGGAMVEHTLKTVDRNAKFEEVVASRGKVVRAEPVAAFYEQKRVHHCAPLSELEDQMCLLTSDGYMGDGSPDRVDALVWALSMLLDMRPPMRISQNLLNRTNPMRAFGARFR
jgi:phage terminase large subunit-like protein